MIKVIVSVGLAMICLFSASKAVVLSNHRTVASYTHTMDFYFLLFLVALVVLTVMAAE